MYLVIDNYISAKSQIGRRQYFFSSFLTSIVDWNTTCKLNYLKNNFTNLSKTGEYSKHFFLNNGLFSVMHKFTTISALLKIRQVSQLSITYCHKYLILCESTHRPCFKKKLKSLKNSFSISDFLIASNDVSKITSANSFSIDFGRLDSGIYKKIRVICSNNYCNIYNGNDISYVQST